VPGFEQGVEMSIEAGEPRPIDEVLSEIERAGELGAEDALTEAVERAPEALRALARRFPGKLRVDRFAVTGRVLRAAQYGGLLELVIQLGAISAELLIDLMSAAARDVRFYATVCAAELRPRNAVFALAERLFDQDFGVRAVAIEALIGYPALELGHAMVRARRAVHSSDPEVVEAASGALVALGDVEAIPDLIGVIERSDRGGDHARRALAALTAQDFGASERKWRRWYEAARRRHRIEWLIEGLGHKEDAIREGAINALRRLTGEYFGYHHDLPRKDRDAAAERWAAWWREAGHRRFTVVPESERHRPTAELPIRRDP
jgi:HEAT repeat protein